MIACLYFLVSQRKSQRIISRVLGRRQQGCREDDLLLLVPPRRAEILGCAQLPREVLVRLPSSVDSAPAQTQTRKGPGLNL